METTLSLPDSQAHANTIDAFRDLINVRQKEVDSANHTAESWYDAMIYTEGQMWERIAAQEGEKVCLVEKVYDWLRQGNDPALLKSALSEEEQKKLVPMLESEVKRVTSVLSSPSSPADSTEMVSFERLNVLKRMLVLFGERV